MDPEQLGVHEQVERELRMALKSLSEPYIDEVDGIQLVRVAHDIAEAVLQGLSTVIEQSDAVTYRILRTIAKGSK
jgi:hypothetical protein